MAQMDDLYALGLQQSAHDVDGGVVAVEEAGCRHKPNRVGGPMQNGRLARRVLGGLHGTHNIATLGRPTKCWWA